MSSCCHTPKEPESSCHTEEQQPQKQTTDYLFWGSFSGVAVLYSANFFHQSLPAYPWLHTMVHTVHQMVHTMWPGVLIGALFVGLMSKIPREFILSILGKGGTFSGLMRATGAGVLLDLCSHGILMVGVKLYERGASAGQVIAFLLASPWNSFSLTLILISLIGFYWTAAFIILSMIVALSTGWMFDLLVSRGVLPQNPNQAILPEGFNFFAEARSRLKRISLNRQFCKEVLDSSLRDSKMVVRWLLVGILLAAVLRALLDPAQFAQYFGPSTIGLLVTIFVATVLEVCSEGSTPIAADILTRANAPGNSFAFLMSGVATDYTEIMVLKDMTKSWKLALFLPLLTVPQVTLIAWLINIYR